MPIYLVACALVSLYFLVSGKDYRFVIERLPSLLFIQRTGIIEKEFIGLAWYISSMLLCMAILYPLLRKHYQMFSLIYGPIFALLIIGFLIHTTGYLGGVSDWLGVTFKCNYRAFAELSLGAACFELSRMISRKEWAKGKRFFFSISALLFTLLSVASTLSTKRIFNDGFVLISMCISVIILFGKVGILSRTRVLYDNKVFAFRQAKHANVFASKCFTLLGSLFLSGKFNSFKNFYCVFGNDPIINDCFIYTAKNCEMEIDMIQNTSISLICRKGTSQ